MRSGYLDGLRGLAVLWMILFHTAYDLRLFGYVPWDFSYGFWYAFPRVIAFTFLFCVGISLNFAHSNKINLKKLMRRSLKIGASAIAVSIGTYIAFPSQWIYFGTLHCIFFGSLLGALLVNHRKIAGALLISILILQYGLGYDIKWVSGLTHRFSMDFIPIYPWFWAILAGLMLGPYLSRFSFLRNFTPPSILKFLGQHSLNIYLVHQPLIFGAIWLFSELRRR